MGGAAMYHQRQTETQRPFRLAHKGGDLLLAPGGVPIEVDAHFADGDKLCRAAFEHLLHLIKYGLRIGRQFRGMETNHGIAQTGVLAAQA